MIEITQVEKTVDITVNPTTEVINIEVTEKLKPVFIIAENEPFSLINQNNIDIIKEVKYIQNNNPLQWLIDLNNFNPYTINEIQSLWIKTIRTDGKIIIYKVINKGKGTYGFNEVQFVIEDFVSVEETILDFQDIVNDQTTEVIELGDLTVIEVFDLEDYLNTSVDLFNLQNNTKNYYFRYDYDQTRYLYYFNAYTSINGYSIYGSGQSQFSDGELVLVYNSGVNLNDQYLKKEEFVEQPVYGTGLKHILLGVERASFIIKSDSITQITGTNVTENYIGYSGKLLRIKNGTVSPKIIKHSTYEWCFRFPSNTDLILMTNEVLTLRQTNTGYINHFDFVSIGREPTTLLVTQRIFTVMLSEIGATDFNDDIPAKIKTYAIANGIQKLPNETHDWEVIQDFNFYLKINAFELYDYQGIEDEATFVSYLAGQGATNIVVTDFYLSEDTLRCNLSFDGTTSLAFNDSGIKKIINLDSLVNLTILDFNTNRQLTSLCNFDALVNLTTLFLYGAPLTTSEFNKLNSWAILAPNNGTIQADNFNLSTTYTTLLAKGWTIYT